MIRSVSKGVVLGFGLAFLVLVANAVVSHINTHHLAERDHWVAHTNEVLANLEAVQSTLREAETGQRGYLITGDKRYLKPYEDAGQTIPQRLRHLQDLTADNGDQQQDIVLLSQLILERFRDLQAAIDARAEGFGPAKQVVITRGGLDKMTTIRDLARRMELRERDLLAERTAASQASYSTAVVSNLVAVLLSLGMVGLAYYLVQLELTARAQAEATARSERERLHLTLTSIGDGVIVTDAAGRVTLLNRVARALTGWADDAQGKQLTEVFPIVNEQTRQLVEDPVQAVLQRGEVVGLANHTLLLARDGRETPIDDSAAPIRDEAGRLTGVVLVFRDVRERKQAEAAAAERGRLMALRADIGLALAQSDNLESGLQQSAEALVRRLDVAFARIWTLAEDSDVLELQASAGLYTHRNGSHGRIPVGQFKIGRIARERRPHLTNSVIGDPNVSDAEWARREGMVAFAGYPLLVEKRVVGVLAAFARRPFSGDAFTDLAPLADGIAQFIVRKRAEEGVHRANAELEVRVQQRTAALSAEIAERQRAEETLRTLADKLQRSNQELEQFASVASHDLQEPLRKIQAFGDRLQAKFAEPLGTQGREYVERMQASASRMRVLINDLLAFSRVSTKAQPFVPVDLAVLTREVVSDLEGRLQQSGGRVELGTLPTVEADPLQMRQLLQNLIGNGLKFHKPGEPPVVRVEGQLLSADTVAGDGSVPRCRLTVRDEGIGFDETYLDRIFEVFQRLHGRGEYEGTGMGLAICRKIVERHGGTITAQSAPGQGATFLVSLPVQHRSEEGNA